VIKFDGDWTVVTPTTERLREAGYMVGTLVDKGVRKYTLHNREMAYGPERLRWPVVFETADLDELNMMVKVLIPTEEK
jgi:hypothetical protein